MNYAGRLADGLSTLISTPMADEKSGALSVEAREALADTIKIQEQSIERFYK